MHFRAIAHVVTSTDFDSVFQYSAFVCVDDNTCTKIVHAFPGLISFQGAYLKCVLLWRQVRSYFILRSFQAPPNCTFERFLTIVTA